MPFEQADEALEQEITKNISPETDQPSTQDILELDKHEKFKWEGKEMTRDELKAHLLRQDDYTRKTQALAKERKEFDAYKAEVEEYKENKRFLDNLEKDLRAVEADHSLASEFKRIYPEKFHHYLELRGIHESEELSRKDIQQLIKQSIAEETGPIKERFHEQEVSAITTFLETFAQKMEQKYPHANEEAVLNRAQALVEAEGVDALTEQRYEEFWKADNERHQQRYENFYKQQIENQKKANEKAKEGGPGGGVPTQGPPKGGGLKGADKDLERILRAQLG